MKEYVESDGRKLGPYIEFKPWIVTLQMQAYNSKKFGYDAEWGIDNHFIERANFDEKEILELETMEDQMQLLAKDDKQYQDDLLRHTIDSMSSFESEMRNIFIYWRNGDVEKLETLLFSDIRKDKVSKSMYEVFFAQRNYKMTRKIMNYLKTKKTYFVVVGSGHIIGEVGIVNLLKIGGYKIEQL
jgi:uncharacterized protein